MSYSVANFVHRTAQVRRQRLGLIQLHEEVYLQSSQK
jgi:hypothetical protein